MTPEELIEASRDLIKDLQDEPSKYARQAPECISQLLARIAELEAALLKSENSNAIRQQAMEWDEKQITQLNARVAALQEIAVENRVYLNRYRVDYEVDDSMMGVFIENAKKELEEEHPEAFR